MLSPVPVAFLEGPSAAPSLSTAPSEAGVMPPPSWVLLRTRRSSASTATPMPSRPLGADSPPFLGVSR